MPLDINYSVCIGLLCGEHQFVVTLSIHDNLQFHKHIRFMYLNVSFLPIDRLAMHEESSSRRKVDDDVREGAVPAYLLDRDNTTRAKVCFSCH